MSSLTHTRRSQILALTVALLTLTVSFAGWRVQAGRGSFGGKTVAVTKNSAAPVALPMVSGATLTVNSNADPGTLGDTFLTLREALNIVNSQSTAGLSAQELAQISGSLGSNDTIQFAVGGLNGGQTITLSTSLAPTRNVIITATGAQPVTIMGLTSRALLRSTPLRP